MLVSTGILGGGILGDGWGALVLASLGGPRSIKGLSGIFDDVEGCTGAEGGNGFPPPENRDHPSPFDHFLYLQLISGWLFKAEMQ